MSNCNICHKPILKGHDLDHMGNHVVCRLDLNKRDNDGVCIKCGKNNVKDIIVCSTCEDNGLDYSGYGGPQS